MTRKFGDGLVDMSNEMLATDLILIVCSCCSKPDGESFKSVEGQGKFRERRVININCSFCDGTVVRLDESFNEFSTRLILSWGE